MSSKVIEKIEGATEKAVDALLKVKDSFWPIKKGEGFERATTPNTREEALSLSILGTNSSIILASLGSIEQDINFLCGLEDLSLTDMTDNLARGFGSKAGKRMELSFNTIKESQEVPNMSMQNFRNPVQYGYEDTKEGKRDFRD